MPEQAFKLVRDVRGSLVHVRRRDDGQCVGCIEVGLFEIVRSLVCAEGTAVELKREHRYEEVTAVPRHQWYRGAEGR